MADLMELLPHSERPDAPSLTHIFPWMFVPITPRYRHLIADLMELLPHSALVHRHLYTQIFPLT